MYHLPNLRKSCGGDYALCEEPEDEEARRREGEDDTGATTTLQEDEQERKSSRTKSRRSSGHLKRTSLTLIFLLEKSRWTAAAWHSISYREKVGGDRPHHMCMFL